MKATKKTYPIFLMALSLCFGCLQAHNSTYGCQGETVCNTIGNYRGAVQWQVSPDGINWVQVPGALSDTLCVSADSFAYYQAEVVDGSCAAVYSPAHAIVPVVIVADAGLDANHCGNVGANLGGSPTASGGGGWYGGAGSGNCRGAGGGSSYTEPTATNVAHQQGVHPGNGQVLLSW